MNVRIRMTDTQTGEILAQANHNYVFNFGLRSDAGFLCVLRWIQSAIRGVRLLKHGSIEVSFIFDREIAGSSLFFSQEDRDKFNENAGAYLV